MKFMPEHADDKNQDSQRQHELDTLLKEALARPGVKEVMEVYQNWQRSERGYDPYRRVLSPPGKVITTDHANAV